MPDSVRQKKQKDALEAYHYWKSGKSSLRQAAAKYNVDKNMVVRAPNLGKKHHSRRFFKNKEEDEIETTITHIVSVERYGLSRLICETANQVLRSKEIQRRKDENIEVIDDNNNSISSLDTEPRCPNQTLAQNGSTNTTSSTTTATSSTTTATSTAAASPLSDKDKTYANPNRNTLTPDLSRGWAKRFIERHPHVGRGVILSSRESKDKHFTFPIVHAWFSIYLVSMKYFNISPSNLYSIGEVSLSDLFKDSDLRCNSSNGKAPAVLETVSGDGTVLPSYFILDEENNASGEMKSMENVTFSSQSTSAGTQFKNHSVDFLINHFDTLTAKKSDNGRLTRGIIIDGTSKFASSFTGTSESSAFSANESTNTNLEFFIEAAKRNIVAFILPVLPGDTYLKPFDQSRFMDVVKNETNQLSVNYADFTVKSKITSEAAQSIKIYNPRSVLNDSEMPNDMINIYTAAKSKITGSDVIVGFSKSGLIPFSPCEVNPLFHYKEECAIDAKTGSVNNDMKKEIIKGEFSDRSSNGFSKPPSSKKRLFSSSNSNSKQPKPSFYLNSVNLLNSDNESDEDSNDEFDDGDEEMLDDFDSLKRTTSNTSSFKASPFKAPSEVEKGSLFSYKFPSAKANQISDSCYASSSSGDNTGDSESMSEVCSPGSITSLSTFSSATSTPADSYYCSKPKSIKSHSLSFSMPDAKPSFISTSFPNYPPLPYPVETVPVCALESSNNNSSKKDSSSKSSESKTNTANAANTTAHVLKPDAISPFSYESAVKRVGATCESFAQIYELYARIKWTCEEFKAQFDSNKYITS